MATKISIINLALLRIGANRLTATEDSERGEVCGIAYDQALSVISAEFSWRSLRRRSTLTESLPAPEFEYRHAFALPNDFVRIYKLWHKTDTEEQREITDERYECENGRLLCNFSNVHMVYICDGNGHEAAFSSKFVDALSYLVASMLAPKLAPGSAVRSDDLLKQYIVMLELSKQDDADNSNYGEEPETDPWTANYSRRDA